MAKYRVHRRWPKHAFYVRWAREFFWRTTKHRQTWLRGFGNCRVLGGAVAPIGGKANK